LLKDFKEIKVDNIMKISFLIIVLISLPLFYGLAQNEGPSIKFEKTSHDFGNIKEAGGNVTYKFEFTNNGTSELIVQSVRPSCGCTTTGWTKEPVKPGEKGFVTAVYNPTNRPGKFNKSLTIVSNANPQQLRIYIQGNVEPKPRSVEDDYPTVMGGLRVKYRSFNFGKLTTEKPVTKTFKVYNNTDEEISFLSDVKTPDHIKVRFTPQALPAKTLGEISVTYDPTNIKLFGFKSDLVVIKTSETTNNVKDFRVVASLEEFFPPMTEAQLAQAPKLTFEDPVYDFGNIKQGESVSTDFVFTNAGKSVLNIRQTRASCGCTVSKPEKSTLQPGESSVIKVTFNSAGRRGIQQKSISVFSNDPANPTQRITIKARVEIEG
jgi:hypothetical protein